MIGKYINVPVFLSSFLIGLILIYIWGPNTKTVVIYPTPENYDTTQYKDKAGQCFQFEPVKTQCSDNAQHVPIAT